jgi:acyl-CoA thioesterase I
MTRVRVPLRRPRVDIVFVGDSLTVGHGASSADAGFAAQVARSAPTPGDGTRAAIVGFSGGCVDDLLSVRLPRPRSLAIVELGTNDWLGYSRRGASAPTPAAAFRQRYFELLSRVVPVSSTARLLCLGVWGVGDRRNGLALAPADYDGIIEAACAARDGRYVSLSSLYQDPRCRGPAGVATPFGLSDDVHPNDRGHQRIAAIVSKAVDHALKR